MKSGTTICIVNYKTEKLTKLCLRSIRKYTESDYRVIVVDNNSNDESTEYLKTLKWIKLIERPEAADEKGGTAHARALDAAFNECETEYFMSLHSDTFVHKQAWLKDLTSYFSMPEKPACVGCGKMDLKPRWQVILKKYTDVKKWIRNLDKNRKRNDFYIRTICSLYRTDILKQENLSFSKNIEKGVTAGKQLYYDLIDNGYSTLPISQYEMADYICHLAHATMVLNPEFTVRKRTEKKCMKKLKKALNSVEVKNILADEYPDR